MFKIILTLFLVFTASQAYANGAYTTPSTFQVKITTTGTAVQLPNIQMTVGLVCQTYPTNTAQTATVSAAIGGSNVNTTVGASGNGYPLAPGQAFSFYLNNAALLYFNGTSGDVLSCYAN